MKVEAHILAWNESDIIGLVIKHYQKFCDHITIWDNYSDDSTQLIAESMGCDVKKFGIKGQLDDQAYLDVKNHAWKGSDSDWCIVCDCDEVLYFPTIKMDNVIHDVVYDTKALLLQACREQKTIIKTKGWNIYSESMPQNDLLEITTGYRFDNYSKSVIFNPKEIKSINYKPGAHICEPVGNVVYSEESLYLLHYKNIGGVERLLRRNAEYRKRLSYNNKKMGYGIHYLDSEAKVRKEWNERIAKSVPLI